MVTLVSVYCACMKIGPAIAIGFNCPHCFVAVQYHNDIFFDMPDIVNKIDCLVTI
jgi:hypothetical protein